MIAYASRTGTRVNLAALTFPRRSPRWCGITVACSGSSAGPACSHALPGSLNAPIFGRTIRSVQARPDPGAILSEWRLVSDIAVEVVMADLTSKDEMISPRWP